MARYQGVPGAGINVAFVYVDVTYRVDSIGFPPLKNHRENITKVFWGKILEMVGCVT